MSDARTIELTVPGSLLFRDVAIRVVMESCKLVGKSGAGGGAPAAEGMVAERRGAAGKFMDTPATALPLSSSYEFDDQFTMEFTSAFSEIYNNIPIHAYEGTDKGTIAFTIHIGPDYLIVDVIDTGKSFDIGTVPLPDEMPTSGMGIHIARTMLDDLEYFAGPPNRWRLVKYIQTPENQPRDTAATD